MLKRCSFFEIKKIVKDYGDNVRFRCVARSHPRWWEGECYTKLAPSKSLLDAIKAKRITWDQYIDIYCQEVLGREGAYSLLKALWKQAQNENLYLVCWERSEPNMMETECHTVLIIEMAEALAVDEKWTC